MPFDISTSSRWGAAFIALLIHTAWIAWVDFRKMIIPDRANLSLGLTGLIWIWCSNQSIPWQITQMVFGGLLFWLVRYFHMRLRQRLGLGLGDVKFAVGATAWVGLIGLPWLILIASISALATMIVFQLAGRNQTYETRIPFGPHLCTGLLATWLALSYGYI
jgi:leader peptidase (prepilin peptidase) / N-methyltransferase